MPSEADGGNGSSAAAFHLGRWVGKCLGDKEQGCGTPNHDCENFASHESAVPPFPALGAESLPPMRLARPAWNWLSL